MLRLLLLGLTPVWGASLRVAPISLRPAGLQVLAAPALGAPAGLSAPLSGLSLAAPALSAPALALPVPAVSPQTPLQRLAVPVPFEAPPASDLRAGKDYADRAFEFKLGAQAAPVSVPADAAAPAFHDDGGGAAYPRRAVSFNGQEFPSVALRPNIPVEKELIKAIDATRETLLIAVYEFKSAGLLDAVRRARARGVKVRSVLDFRNAFPAPAKPGQYQPKRSPEVWALLKEKFDVTVLRGIGEYGINHNKFAVFDGKLAEFGSFNWSRFSENNHYENVVFTDEADRVADLSAYWDYLVWGAVMAAYLAGLQYWWPKISGREINQQVGRFGMVLYLIGVNMTFFPQIILGVRGAPLDLGALEPGPTGLSETAGLGWMFLIFGLGVVLGNLVSVFWSPAAAARNPWGAATLEWRTGSPPPPENFAMEVQAGAPYLLQDFQDSEDFRER